MTPDLQQEFKLLSEKARRQLSEVTTGESYQHVFSIWTWPTFGPSVRWTVYSPRPQARGKSAFASYTLWRSDLDLEKFRSPVERLRYPGDLAPTIRDESVWLTANDVEGFVQFIRGISIPIFPENPSTFGLDGCRFEFRFAQMLFGGSSHWWENYPQEWRPFTEAIMKIIGDLNTQRTAKVQKDGATP
jgi:hypothetical protein